MPSFSLHHSRLSGPFNVEIVRQDAPLRGFMLHATLDTATSLYMHSLAEADLTAIVLECLPHLSPDRLQQVQLGITMRREQMRAALAQEAV